MRTLMAQPFTLDDVTRLRRAVAVCARSCGLSSPRLDDFVLAVHESVVNAVEHGGGHGYFKLWTVNGVIRSETSDKGAGIPDGYVNGGISPLDLAQGGRGIFLIRRLCDTADFDTGPDGTTVLLTMRLPGGPERAAHEVMKRIRVMAGCRPFGRFTA